MNNNNIFLIGMMGAGKTAIGKLLAEKLKLTFFDMDSEIEKIMDISINQIFNDYGEKRFRLIEATFFRECTKVKNIVYSTGGGIIENKVNQGILKNRGVSIFLDCSIETLKSRLINKTNDRPMLGNVPEKKLVKLYNQRYSLYDSCAHININTDNLSPSQTIQKIIEKIE